MLHLIRLSLLTLAATGALSPAAAAEDPCAGFSWNIAHEPALFAGAARTLAAGRDAATASSLEVERLYEVALAGHEQVQPPAADRRAHDAGSGFKIVQFDLVAGVAGHLG